MQDPKLQSLIAERSNEIRDLEMIIALHGVESITSLILKQKLAKLVAWQTKYKRIVGNKYL